MITIENQNGESVTIFKHSIIKIKTSNSQTTIFFVDGSIEVFNFDELKLNNAILPKLK